MVQPKCSLLHQGICFWRSTVFCSFFVAKDKDINETEALKEPQDLSRLRYPDKYDISLYIIRVITGGLLGFIAVILFNAGLLVIKGGNNNINITISFAVSFLAGFYQQKFKLYLDDFMEKVLNKKRGQDDKTPPGSKPPGGGGIGENPEPDKHSPDPIVQVVFPNHNMFEADTLLKIAESFISQAKVQKMMANFGTHRAEPDKTDVEIALLEADINLLRQTGHGISKKLAAQIAKQVLAKQNDNMEEAGA